MKNDIFVAKQEELKNLDPSFVVGEITTDKNEIFPRSVILVNNKAFIVEYVENDKVHCIDFSDDDLKLFKLSDEIVVLGHYVV